MSIYGRSVASWAKWFAAEYCFRAQITLINGIKSLVRILPSESLPIFILFSCENNESEICHFKRGSKKTFLWIYSIRVASVRETGGQLNRITSNGNQSTDSFFFLNRFTYLILFNPKFQIGSILSGSRRATQWICFRYSRFSFYLLISKEKNRKHLFHSGDY